MKPIKLTEQNINNLIPLLKQRLFESNLKYKGRYLYFNELQNKWIVIEIGKFYEIGEFCHYFSKNQFIEALIKLIE